MMTPVDGNASLAARRTYLRRRRSGRVGPRGMAAAWAASAALVVWLTMAAITGFLH
ncbi:MAG TPA: hypothetical protein VI316_12200 [Candidatus Dormibacteraeota bacterium]